MIEIYQIKFSKAHLDTAPEDERIFHLMAGQLANDLNLLTKQLVFAMNPVDGPDVCRRVNTALAMLLVRQLAGRLNEGWKIIESQFNPMYKRYKETLSETGKESHSKIKKYFNTKDNLIFLIRNKVAFHTDAKNTHKAYNDIPSNEVLVDYLSEHRGNCLYYSSELLSMMSMLALVKEGDWQIALDTLSREVTDTADLFCEFILDFMRAFMEKYVERHLGDIDDDKIILRSQPSIYSVQIPFFCEPPKKLL
jgi:hypothetical protein